jgi:hypothetical protein
MEKSKNNWYGIEGIEFIYHGEWSDPEICYKNHVINCHDIEDGMWEEYLEYLKENGVHLTEEEMNENFGNYMRRNKEEVYSLFEDMIADDYGKEIVEDSITKVYAPLNVCMYDTEYELKEAAE